MYSIKQLIDYKYIGDVLSLAILRISLAVVFRCFTEQDWVEKKKKPSKNHWEGSCNSPDSILQPPTNCWDLLCWVQWRWRGKDTRIFSKLMVNDLVIFLMWKLRVMKEWNNQQISLYWNSDLCFEYVRHGLHLAVSIWSFSDLTTSKNLFQINKTWIAKWFFWGYM